MQKLKTSQGQAIRIKVVEKKSESVTVHIRKALQPQARELSLGLIFLG